MTELHDDLHPLDPSEHAAQLAGVLALMPDDARVVDLGSGVGRIAGPLAGSGREVLAVDSDPTALRHERWSEQPGIEPLEEDFLSPDATWQQRGPFDSAVCLGNTLSLILGHEDLACLFERVATSLDAGGSLLVDDFPIWGWDAVHAGDWPSGVSEDGSAQIIWCPGDPIFAFRTGSSVDPESDCLRPGERGLRLWSLSELDFLAGQGGLAAAVHHPEQHLLRFDRL